jgi:hypothetical protein
MIKNTAGQAIGAQMVSASDGSAFTGAVTCYVCGDGGTQAAGSVGSGACTHEGNGYHTYAPAQAETNYSLIAFTFTGSGAIPATVQVETTIASSDPWAAALPGDYAEGSAGYLLSDLHERLEAQVADGPAVVVPAPAAGQTTAWAMCYDEDGLIEEGVQIYIQCVCAAGNASVYDGAEIILTSDAAGLAAGPIPRGPSLKFTARRGVGGRRVRFAGVDADSLALPGMVGTP